MAAVAVQAGAGLVPASWRRAPRYSRLRWLLYLVAGGTVAAGLGPWLVLVLLACGVAEVVARRVRGPSRDHGRAAGLPALAAAGSSPTRTASTRRLRSCGN